MKSVIAALLKLLITGFFFVYIFGKVDFHRFTEILRGADICLVAGTLLTLWLGHFVCILRWRIIMRQLMPVPPLSRLAGIYCIGMFFNLALPTIIGGDAVKVYYAGKPAGTYAESFASTFFDRNVGMLAMIAIACSAVLFYPVSVPGVSIPLILWGVFILFAIGNIAVFTPRFHRVLSSAFQKARLRKIAAKIDAAARAFRIIGKRPAALMRALGISFVNQFLVCAAVWIAAFSLNIRIPPIYFLIFVPTITLISMIPVSLNGMGLREYSFMSLFGAIGIADESCVALGVLYSLIVILSSLPGGAAYILFRKR
ncbi:MAG: flippase-like domain-containing protein [Acidobacteriota bacterium]|jgi:uncharacterized protein (TIRG00374 family)|nr:flippase-like domain-containing protein [Acidobacteriota bacterium]